MRSFSSLVHDALFPSTRVYHDENGNYRGTSTDITPWMLLLGRIWGILLWLYIILMPLLAPVYFVFAHWFCRKYDAEFTKEDPKGWPSEKKEILKNHRNILIGWIIFMVWGYFSDWGGDDFHTNTLNQVKHGKNQHGIRNIRNYMKTHIKNTKITSK